MLIKIDKQGYLSINVQVNFYTAQFSAVIATQASVFV